MAMPIIIYQTAKIVLYAAVALCGLIAAVQVLLTREDAFRAADRLSKFQWAALLVGAGIVTVTPLPIVSWVGMVIIGVYWCDVRPQIRRLLGRA